jgi:predicted transcriptional regulator
MSSATGAAIDLTQVFQVNQKKLKELAENASSIKIGGKVRSYYY